MASYEKDLLVSAEILKAIQFIIDKSAAKSMSIEHIYALIDRDKLPQKWDRQQERWDLIIIKAKEIHQMILDRLLFEVEENIKEV